jgi:nucleoside-diphosphate-sugar epimerase
MANVLITGGAGFVGSMVARQLLAAGHRVRIVDNLMHGGNALLDLWGLDEVDVVVGDVCEPEVRARCLDGVNGVVHLAAIVGDPACKREPELAWRINYEATRALIQEAAQAGVGRFVFASTCSNYGVSEPDQIVDEDSPLNPVSLYAESKVKSEQDALDAASATFDPVILRFATVYGVSPRMRFDLLVNDFTREAVIRKKIVIYGEQFWRPHVHVADVARAVKMVIEAPRIDGPRVFNVGDGSQNFQKLAIAQMAVEAVPGTELDLVKKDEDPRSYRVNFDRVHTTFGYAITRTASDGVEEVRRLLANRVITDYDDPKYVN